MTPAKHVRLSRAAVALTPANQVRLSRTVATLGLLVSLLVVALGALLVPATPAAAHAVLTSSSPASGAVVETAPAEVVLTFTESVRKVPDRIRVIGPDGQRVDRGEPRFEGVAVTIPVDPSGPNGTYLVTYRVVSADSHPVSGGYTYSVGAPSTPPTDTGGGAGDRIDPVVSTGVKVAKYLGYAGLALLVGSVLVVSLLWPRRLARRGPTRLAAAGLVLIAVATVAGLWLQVPYTAGGGLFAVTATAFGDVLGSTFGATHLVRLGLLVTVAILLRPVLIRQAGRTDLMLLAVLGVAGLLTWPLAGHPAATPVPAVSVLTDTLHLAGMAVWLGGLTMLALFLLPRASDRELGAILPIWSRWAALAVTTLLLAGTVQALIEVSTPAALVDTTYGRLLLAKVGLFAVVIAVAGVSRRVVRRRVAAMSGGAIGPAGSIPAAEDADVTAATSETPAAVGGVGAGRPSGLRRLVVAEMAVIAVVLGVAAVLVQQTPARTAITSESDGAASFFTTTLSSNLYNLRVEVDPDTTGNNYSLHLYAYGKDNKPLPVVEWKATVALPERGVEPLDVPLLPISEDKDHAYGDVSLPQAGTWQFRFTLRLSEIDQATVTVAVPIK